MTLAKDGKADFRTTVIGPLQRDFAVGERCWLNSEYGMGKWEFTAEEQGQPRRGSPGGR